jgi:hypothetical protein
MPLTEMGFCHGERAVLRPNAGQCRAPAATGLAASVENDTFKIADPARSR